MLLTTGMNVFAPICQTGAVGHLGPRGERELVTGRAYSENQRRPRTTHDGASYHHPKLVDSRPWRSRPEAARCVGYVAKACQDARRMGATT